MNDDMAKIKELQAMVDNLCGLVSTMSATTTEMARSISSILRTQALQLQSLNHILKRVETLEKSVTPTNLFNSNGTN